MKYYIDPDGKQHRTLPKVWNKTSPITEEYVLSHGWSIHEGENAEEELVGQMTACIAALQERLPYVSAKDFIRVAKDGFSRDIITWAKEQGVPDNAIAEARDSMLGFIGDASRLGMTWDDLFNILDERMNHAD